MGIGITARNCEG